MNESNITPFVNNSIIFFKSAYCVYSKLIVFRRFFTWTAPGDIDLLFWLILVKKKPKLLKKNYISHVNTTPTQLTQTCDWWRDSDSLSVSLQHKTSAARDRLCQIALNRKIFA